MLIPDILEFMKITKIDEDDPVYIFLKRWYGNPPSAYKFDNKTGEHLMIFKRMRKPRIIIRIKSRTSNVRVDKYVHDTISSRTFMFGDCRIYDAISRAML